MCVFDPATVAEGHPALNISQAATQGSKRCLSHRAYNPCRFWLAGLAAKGVVTTGDPLTEARYSVGTVKWPSRLF
jgi:hypothetical protein